MTESKSNSTVSISGTRVMLGASRGLSKSTLLALIEIAEFSSPDMQLFLKALDAGLCKRMFSMSQQWMEYRDNQLLGGASPDLVGARNIADVVLWLWLSLQHEYGNPSSEGVLHAVSENQFELAVVYLDVGLANITLDYTVKYINRALLMASEGGDVGSEQDLQDFFEAASKHIFSPMVEANGRRMLGAANKLGIPWNRLTHDNYQLGWGANARRVTGSHTDRTSVLAQGVVKNKAATHYLLAKTGFPRAQGGLADTEALCLSLAERIGFPLVVKPANQDLGKGVTTHLTNNEEVKRAFKTASQYGPVLVEKHIEGQDYRLLVVGGRLLAAAHRIPAGVTGNGSNSVRELMDKVNADPRRGADKAGLMRIDLDDEAIEVLRKQALTPDSVPDAGRFVTLREASNVARGGTPVDVTQSVHPDNRLLAERASRIVGLDIAGIDLMITDITKSWRKIGGVIIEVNSAPSLNVHWVAQPERDICAEILNWVFDGGDGRIPVAAVAGGEGQDIVSRIVHRIMRSAGTVAGMASRDGVWVGDTLELEMDASGCLARDVLLTDPSVEAAVIEVSAEGLMSQGHPCDRYTVAALLNISGGNETEQSSGAAAQTLSEVLGRTTEAVVVNADDPMCLEALKDAAPKRRVLASQSEKSVALQTHLAQGGEAVFVEESGDGAKIVIAKGAHRQSEIPLVDLMSVPPDKGGDYMLYSLCSVALAYVMGIDVRNVIIQAGGDFPLKF